MHSLRTSVGKSGEQWIGTPSRLKVCGRETSACFLRFVRSCSISAFRRFSPSTALCAKSDAEISCGSNTPSPSVARALSSLCLCRSFASLLLCESVHAGSPDAVASCNTCDLLFEGFDATCDSMQAALLRRHPVSVIWAVFFERRPMKCLYPFLRAGPQVSNQIFCARCTISGHSGDCTHMSNAILAVHHFVGSLVQLPHCANTCSGLD